MRAFLLLCSLLGLSLAQNNPSLFADRTGTTVSGASQTVSFTFSVNGKTYNNLVISKFGAVYPGSSDPSGLTSSSTTPAFNTAGLYTVIGPLWSTAFSNGVPATSGDNSITYSTKTRNTASETFFSHWASQVNAVYNPTSAFVCTWWRMENKAGTSTVSFQLILLVDANEVTYAFYNYGEINWSVKNNFRPGFNAAVNGANAAYNYESPYSSLGKIQTSPANGKLGQTNFFYKLSITPFVDVHLSSDSSKFTSISGQYVGIEFTPNVDSHGATAFNFFSSPKTTTQPPVAFAYINSYLYCFTKAYSGDPAKMSTGGHFAKSNAASNGVWEFPSTHNFLANTPYYCYCDTPVTANLIYVPAGSKRSSSASYVGSSPAGFTAATQPFAYQFATILFGAAQADPVFKSLRTGDSFIFGGEAGKHFNLYHDRYVNLNAEFAYAVAEKQEGTIISKVGVMVGGHKISFGAADFALGSIQVNLDGKSVKLFNDKVHLSGCVDIHYLAQWNAFYIVSPTHKLKFNLDERHSDHIDGKYINIAVEDVPESKEDIDSLGGVIGQTIKAGPINTFAEDFAVAGLFSAEKSNYKAAEFEDCA